VSALTLDPEMVEHVFGVTRSVQHRFDQYQKPEKIRAKERGSLLIREHLTAGRILDIGGEDFYHRFYDGFDVVTHNLPDDMHEMPYRAEFDAVLAMHVLEHSPFPLYVLALINRALKPGGLLYVAVPRPCDKFCRVHYGHWSVMRARMWATLIVGAGFSILRNESGKFGDRKQWIEHRFLCQTPAVPAL